MMFRICCILLTWYALLMPVSGQSSRSVDMPCNAGVQPDTTCGGCIICLKYDECEYCGPTDDDCFWFMNIEECRDEANSGEMPAIMPMMTSTDMPNIPSTNMPMMPSSIMPMMSTITDPLAKCRRDNTCESAAGCMCMHGGTCIGQGMGPGMGQGMGPGMGQRCRCPDGFTGDKCHKASCPRINEDNVATGRDRVSWPETVVTSTDDEIVVESIERCPVNTENREHGIARRICFYNESLGGQWHNISFQDCGSYERPGIEHLSKTPVTEDNVQEVTDTLARILENSTSDNVKITDARTVLNNIVNARSPSPNVTESVIKTIDSILSANIPSGDQDSANASSEILKSVEKQVSYTIEKHGQFSSFKPNIAVEGVTINETRGIGFGISQTDAASFDPDAEENEQIDGSSIQLPKDVFENGNSNGTKVSFIAYNDNKLFQSLERKTSVAVGPIISAVVLGKDVFNLTKPVIIQIIPNQDSGTLTEAQLNTSTCVYWDFSKRNGIGDWAEDGCELMSAESGKITCHCNHLTNFAVLVDFSGGTMNFVLDVISKVGCAASIVGLCLTLMIFLCCRGLRISLQRKILIQFCISMLGLYFAFLLGIDSTGSEIGCIIVAALLHYFVLTTVLWMGVEARHMYITLVAKSDRVGRKFLIKAGIFAWGVGLLPVGVVLGIKQGEYLAKPLLYCFVAPNYGLFFGLLLPIGLVILHNIITFGLVARKLLSSRAYVKKSDLENRENEGGDGEFFQKTGVKEISQRLLNAFAVSIPLGITWVFGFLAIEEARFAFQLLFCICNSFQGVLIFILFCYGQKDVRKIICARCFSEPPSQPKVKQMKKPAATGATSVSNDTRLTGESYTEDNDTVVTKIDGMTMTVLESETMDSHEEDTDQKYIPNTNQKEANGKHGSNSEPATEQTDLSAKSETDKNDQ
ncbi:adhesion G-protein coupled receptor G7-like [Amphiura filiformis]|uniref:adhesion G-protein coupled receptor G7-like n=1 Tax=Amphiura filiformis TaxID=82378 RepID=UPI003B20DF90